MISYEEFSSLPESVKYNMLKKEYKEKKAATKRVLAYKNLIIPRFQEEHKQLLEIKKAMKKVW